MKTTVFKRMNERMGRELPYSVKARAKSIIVGVVFNMPDSDDYKEKTYKGKDGLVKSYDKTVSMSVVDFSKTYPFGMSYGIVLAIGPGIESDIVKGDKVLLRTLPEETMIYDGEIFHIIKDWDIQGIIKDSNKDLESSNG